MSLKHQQRRRRGKEPGRARGRQSRHKGTWMLKSSFMFLRVKEWPLPALFWADKDLPRKLLIAERRTEFCVQFRRNEKHEKHEIGEECCRSRLQRQSEGCSSKQRRAGQGAPGPLHDTSLHQQAGLTGSQQDISHSGLIWDQKDPARPLYHLHFQHEINAWKQHWNYPLYFLWLPRSRQKMVGNSSSCDATSCPHMRKVYFLDAMPWNHHSYVKWMNATVRHKILSDQLCWWDFLWQFMFFVKENF